MTSKSKKARVLMINPPHIQKKGKFARACFEPVGLAYVAANLEKEGYEVRILDAIAEAFDQYNHFDEFRETVGLSFPEITDRIKEFAPDFVGIGAPFTVRAEAIYKTVEVVKEVNPSIITFLGGIHVATYAREVLSKPGVDFIVQGEGEIICVRLLDGLLGLTNEDIYKMKDLGFKKDGEIVVNPRASGIVDLDALPNPARHLLPIHKYFEASARRRAGRYGKRAISVSTSRGCPFECTFCTTHDMMGKTYRYRSPENVARELKEVKELYGAEVIHFEDDQLTIRKDRFEELCDKIIEADLGLKWDTPNGVLASPIADEKLIEKMAKSGCYYLCVAPESGDQYVVDKIIKKRQKLVKVDYVIEKAVKYGITVDAFFVIGNVGETKQQIVNSIEYAKKIRRMGVRWCHFHVATPFDSTPLYKLAEGAGFLVEHKRSELEFVGEKRIQTTDFTVEDVDKLYTEAMSVNPYADWDKVKDVIEMFRQEPKKVVGAFYRHLLGQNASLSQ